MADIKAKEERVERSPAWQQHIAELANISQAGDASFFPAGTKTMRHQEMDSANTRHRQSIASQEKMQGAQLSQQYRMHAESLAHQRWYDQQRMDLAWAEYNATKEALRGSASTQNDFNDQLSQLYAGDIGKSPTGSIDFGALSGRGGSKTSSQVGPTAGFVTGANMAPSGGNPFSRPTGQTTMSSIPTTGGPNRAAQEPDDAPNRIIRYQPPAQQAAPWTTGRRGG